MTGSCPPKRHFWEDCFFGAIGVGAMLFGKVGGSVVKMVLDAALVACSYLIEEGWLLWTSGSLLTLLLFRWKE